MKLRKNLINWLSKRLGGEYSDILSLCNIKFYFNKGDLKWEQ